MSRALLVVDVQVDFCEDGSLPVEGGKAVARGVAELLERSPYDVVVASLDWHVDPGAHFGDPPDYVDSWPRHCVVGTAGAQPQPPLREDAYDAVVRKGEHAAAYSAFEGTSGPTPLRDWLAEHDVTELDVCGVATDHCVRASVLDARAAGLPVRVLLGLCAGVAPATTQAAIEQMERAGASVVR